MSKETKKDRVKNWFDNNKGSMMTIWEARDVFRMNGGTYTSIISRLIKSGEDIVRETRVNPETGDHFTVYFKHKESKNETGFPDLS